MKVIHFFFLQSKETDNIISQWIIDGKNFVWILFSNENIYIRQMCKYLLQYYLENVTNWYAWNRKQKHEHNSLFVVYFIITAIFVSTYYLFNAVWLFVKAKKIQRSGYICNPWTIWWCTLTHSWWTISAETSLFDNAYNKMAITF